MCHSTVTGINNYIGRAREHQNQSDWQQRHVNALFLELKEYGNLNGIFNTTDLALYRILFILIHQLWTMHVRSVDTALCLCDLVLRVRCDGQPFPQSWTC